MSTIRNLEDIKIPENRVRKVFDAQKLEELIQSILLPAGLLHPPVVDRASGTLLCGERRFRAIQEIAKRGLSHIADGKTLRPGLICTLDVKELSRSDWLEAEINENTIRVDISWQEKAEAVARLHELRQAQKEEQAIPGLPAPKQTLKETAAELRGTPEVTRSSVDDVRADVTIAAWLRDHPDDQRVSSAKTRADALKIIETELVDAHRAALARRFLRAHSSTTSHIIKLTDLRETLPETPDAIYDCICTDPPWGVGAHTWANGGSDRRHSYTDDLAQFETIHVCLAEHGFRVSKPRAHLYLFCSIQQFDLLKRMFMRFGWDVWPQPLVWSRASNQGLAPRPDHGPRNTYEAILFGNKGDKRTLLLGPDVIYAPKPGVDPRAAAKPPQIYWELLRRSVVPGDEVLDPCCGSGPIIPAANLLQVRATCYDIAEDAVGLTSSRINERLEPVTYEITARGSAHRKGVRVARADRPEGTIAP